MTTVSELDAMPVDAAANALQSCCGSRAWVSGMLTRRPFGTVHGVLAAAEEVLDTLGDADWLEAFSHHPRLGERRAQAATTEQSRGWSALEQSRMSDSPGDVRAAIADANVEYEARFGYIPIICAMGMTANEILAITRSRLQNSPGDELRIAANEQRKITRLRLERLLEATNIGEQQ